MKRCWILMLSPQERDYSYSVYNFIISCWNIWYEKKLARSNYFFSLPKNPKNKNSGLYIILSFYSALTMIRDLSYLLFYKWIDIFITILCIFFGDHWVLHICQKYTEANKGNLMINIIFCTMFNIQLYLKWFLKWNFIFLCVYKQQNGG